ncbi:putative histone deacetylase [Helianthus annuus]|nr:putative histone deacetylase [Helianthus annuus]
MRLMFKVYGEENKSSGSSDVRKLVDNVSDVHLTVFFVHKFCTSDPIFIGLVSIITAVHTNNHANLIKAISSKNMASKGIRVAANYNSLYFSEGSSESAYLVIGPCFW